jgi:hypothetical protein
MRCRPLLDVTDIARRAIAQLQPARPRTARGALATRESVIAYLQDRLDHLSTLAPWWDDEPLSADESKDASAAIQYLRSAGKSDSEIRSWLLLQRARYDLRMGSQHDGTTQRAHVR